LIIIPWSTDAPIYHRPWATMALMAANVVALVAAMASDPDRVEPLLLAHGQGLHPLQWVTSNFLHEGPGHLIGNLVFLWSFALIVEGKLGFARFLAVYLGLGFVQCGLEQAATLGMGESHSLGASAIVYGIMAMAMAWAPRNELTCLWFFGFRGGLYLEVAIVWFALLYIAFETWEVLFWGATLGFPVATAILHLSGAVLGFALATAMLRLGWVDCEGWDLYSILKGHHGRPPAEGVGGGVKTVKMARKKKPKGKSKAKAAESAPEDRYDAAHRRLRGHLDAGDVLQAHAAYDKALRTLPGWTPRDADWVALIQALLEAQDYRSGVATMEDYLRRSPKASPKVRLRLAQVLIKHQQRPAHALTVLDAIPAGTLPENLQSTARQLRRQAEQMREEGVLELEGEAW